MFDIIHRDSNTKARAGMLTLAHGKVETPVFMPVGTNATVKAMFHDDLREMGIKLILGNTYHLYLRPGVEVIEKFGGLHRFSNWAGNILTDSGGFQVFSLAPFRKIEDQGVYFRSHIDGAYHRLSPEKVIQIQNILRSDIMMPLDVCTPPGITYKKALDAVLKTTDWLKRSKDEWLKENVETRGRLFGIVQGNFFKDLRKQSVEDINNLDLSGIAIGGLSVGEEYSLFVDFLSYTAELLDPVKPHYLMGIGTPDYILDAVENGIDIFDCVFPTRIARNGSVFTAKGQLALKKVQNRLDDQPIEEGCECYACKRYSRAYLRHVFKANEIIAPMLATWHNLYFLNKLSRDIRASILDNRFSEFKKDFLKDYRGE
ncbi:MAG: tRNA guanosine(34) transglycosylase Tgt [Spirochaetales bacterium]|nr:tRNA guanosine(34) transglycosylase Tgt [Spirochaetales bacterium]